MSNKCVSSEQWRRLEEAIRAVEGKGGAAGERLATGWARVDRALGGGLARGALHEWRGEAVPVGILAHLASRAARAGAGPLVWAGKGVWPHPPVLARFDRGVLARSLFVDAPEPGERVWAADAALRGGAGAVAIEAEGLAAGAYRRLQLAAEAGGGIALAGAAEERGGTRSAAAATRWRVTPRSGERPGWRIERLGGTEAAWALEWCDAQGHLLLASDGGDRPAAPPVAAADPAGGADDAHGARGSPL